MERSPIAAYRGNPYECPNQIPMSYTPRPYSQNLIPNAHYSAYRAVEEFHRMHPSKNAKDLALGYRHPNGPSPSQYTAPVTLAMERIMKEPKTSATAIPPLPPHTTTYGYGHPGYSSNPPPPTPMPNPYHSYEYLVPPTPYSDNDSFVYGNQSQASSMGTALKGIKFRNSITRKDLHWTGDIECFSAYQNQLFG